MSIRPASPADAAAIARIQVASYQTAYAGLLPQPYLDRFDVAEQQRDWQDWIASRDDVLLVAEDQRGQVQGYALGRLVESSEDSGAGELVSLHIGAGDQRRWVGWRLVRAVAQALAERGATRLVVWVLRGNRATGFYERLGGVPGGMRRVDLDPGVSADEVLLTWEDIRTVIGCAGELRGAN